MTAGLHALLAGFRPGFALQGGFYADPTIYEAEIGAIFLRSWLYVGHQSQVPRAGDWFLHEIAGESVIVVRGADGAINALLNVCRHRGSRVCVAASGHDSRLVCRYHGWTYGLDGSLRAAAHLSQSVAKGDYGLRRLHVRLLEGLVFINFAADPPPFDELAADMAAPLAPYALGKAKVAHRQNYPIAANWKLTVENYCECYHCGPAHPEYSVAHGRAVPPAEFEAELRQVMARAPDAGLTQHVVRRSWLDAGRLGIERGFDRYPLFHGQLSGSRDGQPVAPLLGTIRAFDGGTTDLHLGATTFGLAYCDHVVLYRFTPRGQHATDCEITWLVNESAVEGRDYNLADLTWLWDVTTIADKTIIERNQEGVASRWYVPGPLSEMEAFTAAFLDWYIAALRAATAAPAG